MTTTATQHVSDTVRELVKPDEFGRTMPLALYATRGSQREQVTRNLTVESAERLAARYVAEGYHVHVSLDVCG